jgi:hypothetical protein
MPTHGRFASVAYQERIPAPVVWWIIGLGVVASMSVAVFAYVDVWIGVVFTVLAVAAVVVGLLAYTLRIVVDDGVLAVGRNRLEGRYIAGAVALEGTDAERALGPAADRRSFLATRPYVRSIVRVELDDPADPHPAWLVGSRRPNELAAAVRGIKED